MAEADQKGKGPTRKRLSTRRSFDPISLQVSKETVTLQERRLMSGKTKRPTRWRGPKNNDSSLKTWIEHTPPAIQSQAVVRSAHKQLEKPENHAPKPQNVELRFSFSVAPDEAPSRRGREETIAQSFSGLSMSGSLNRSVSADPSSHTKVAPAQEPRRHSESIYQAPQLEKPKKKREGYGFSYSETFMCDSDEYPDTECEWEPEDQDSPKPKQVTDYPAHRNYYLNWEPSEHISRPSSRLSTSTIQDDSFNEMVVLRDVGSFHLARPQRNLSCTPATREDTLRLKVRAKSLVARFEESGEIQAQLLTRMERMMYIEQQRQSTWEANSMEKCALKLRDFLIKVKEERIETGEHRTIVEHEIEWAEWLVEASKTGVMHVRSEGCSCRPDWDPE